MVKPNVESRKIKLLCQSLPQQPLNLELLTVVRNKRAAGLRCSLASSVTCCEFSALSIIQKYLGVLAEGWLEAGVKFMICRTAFFVESVTLNVRPPRCHDRDRVVVF